MDPLEFGLTHNTEKTLSVQLGADAGTEIAAILRRMGSQIEELKRSKVEVTSVVPSQSSDRDVWMGVLD